MLCAFVCAYVCEFSLYLLLANNFKHDSSVFLAVFQSISACLASLGTVNLKLGILNSSALLLKEAEDCCREVCF